MSAVDVRVVNPDGQGAVLPSGYSYVSSQPPPNGGNAYYDALKALPSFWLGYPLRTQAEIDTYKKAGTRPGVAYDPAMDAMKAWIPPIKAATIMLLASNIDATTTMIPLVEKPGGPTWDSAVILHGILRADAEYMLITAVNLTAKTATVTRGALGSTATPHVAGVEVFPGTNSLQNYVALPLGTQDGHTYLFTWDSYFTSSHLRTGTGLKGWQFTSGSDAIWFELQIQPSTRYFPSINLDTDICGITCRSYNKLGGDANWSLTDGNHVGPGITAVDVVTPLAGQFIVKPNRWTRFWVRIQQRANDYDPTDVWVADSETPAVQIYRQLPLSVRPTGKKPNQIEHFWVELNASQDTFIRGDLRDEVSYHRNFAALRDPGDISTLLAKP